jgi:CsoR family transcriptional regulator, copper-sensing transcriptional repressor
MSAMVAGGLGGSLHSVFLYPLGVSTFFLTSIPYRGMRQGMDQRAKSGALKRLGRIEGQVRGLARMVVVTQVSAVRAALRRFEEEVLREHVAHCVEHAIQHGDAREQRRKVEELMQVLARSSR